MGAKFLLKFISVVLVLFLLMSILSLGVPSKTSASSLFLSSKTVHDGDLVVSGNDILVIENSEYDLIGNLTVKDNATLIIRNSTFNQTGPPINATENERALIFVEDNARLVITNATVIISQRLPSRVSIDDHATLEITDSVMMNNNEAFYVWPLAEAVVYLTDSEIHSPSVPTVSSVVVVDENSTVHIKNLVCDRVVAWGNAVVWIENSTLENGLRGFYNCTVSARDSTVGFVTAEQYSTLTLRSCKVVSYVLAANETKVWLIHSSAENVMTAGESTVWLIDSSVEAINEYDNSSIQIGWELPIFGIIAFHYTFIPTLRMIMIALTAVVIFLVVLVIVMRWRRQRGKPKPSNTQETLETISPP
jgi:hypothetical protein